MNLTENKIVFEQTENTSCSAIFHAVCDELGKHYSEKGFRYSATQKLILD